MLLLSAGASEDAAPKVVRLIRTDVFRSKLLYSSSAVGVGMMFVTSLGFFLANVWMTLLKLAALDWTRMSGDDVDNFAITTALHGRDATINLSEFL
jgi:hypothetical protein